jgi:serine protease Do
MEDSNTPKVIDTKSDDLRNKIAAILLLILVCATAGFGGGYIGSKGRVATNGSIISPENQQAVLSESQLISAIAKNVSPSVVSVDVTVQTPGNTFFGTPGRAQQSAGTGIIISEDGYIVTNRHVIDSATTSVSVTLSDGTEFEDVEIIGRTPEGDPLDVAFLKIKDTKGIKLTAAKLGDASKVQVGDKVVAIGNALGQFQNTVTSGIISGFGRSVEAGDGYSSSETLQNLIQTDASINEGNSGGPLVNISGEVIGINTAIAGGGAENIGFAIPMSDIQGLIKSVLEKGKLERPYLGVRYIMLTDDYAYEYNLSAKRGAYILPSRNGISSIVKDSPAEKSGLKEKDIITEINGEKIDEKHSLISLISKHPVGQEVSVKIIRDGQEQTLKATLEATPER